MARGKRITEEEYKAIQQAIDNGIPILQIAKMFGRPNPTIYRIKNGVQRVVPEKKEVKEEHDIDFVLKLKDNTYNILSTLSRFYGFTSNGEFVMSCINEKYYEVKDEIDRISERETRQRQFDEEYSKLKEKYADLFERATEPNDGE